jgi:hypothetical protein
MWYILVTTLLRRLRQEDSPYAGITDMSHQVWLHFVFSVFVCGIWG